MTSLRHNRRVQILALVAVLVLGASAAWAYWVAPSSGHGTGRVGSLAGPSGVGASAPTGGTTVSLSWTASAPEGGPSPSGYYAERWSAGTPTVVGGACGTPGSPVATTSCADSAVPDGTYTYTLLAVYRSWTASSGHSAPVTVAKDTTPPLTTLASEPASPDGSNGWFRQSSVGFTLSASDAGSGVASTSYSIDGGAPHPYSSAVTISTPGDHTVSYWSTDEAGNEETHHTAHVKLDASAPETSLALTPSSPSGANGWYTSTPSFTLSASDATSGVASSSYQLDGDATKAYPGSAVAIPAGQHTVTYWSTDNAGNAESAHMSAQVKVDTTAPSDSLSLGSSPVHAFQNGSTVYFASSLSGSFTLLDTVADAGSGAASARFPQLTASHWTHTAETISSPAGGPFASSSYSWTSGAAAPSAAERTVTSTDVAGNTSTGSSLTFLADSTTPSGGALVVNGKAASAGGTESSANTTSFTVSTRTDYTDSGSGLASSTLTVQSSALSKGACGTPGSAGAYTSPTVIAAKTNPAIASGYCYLYTLTGTDNVGNTASISTTVKVDTTAPTSSISLGTANHAFLKETTLYYAGAGAGSFTLLDTVGDANSGPASAVFPALSTFRWTHSKDTVTTPAEGPYSSSTYSWSSNASAPSSSSERTVTATDNAGNTTNTTLTFVSDTAAPSGGALTVNGTAASGTGITSTSNTGSFSISSRTDYKETQSSTQSGLESSVLTIQSETLSNGACGAAAGAYATPAVISGTSNPAIATGYCYLYTLTGTDNVENEASVSTTVKVDTTAPGAPLVALSSATGNTFVSGTTVYINPQSGKSGSFVATGSASDAESGITTIKLPSLSGFTSGGGAIGSPFETTYKWSGSVGASGAQSATATNGTGLSEANASAFTVTPDTTAPSGGSVSVPARANGSAPVTFAAGTDSGSGISTSLNEILRAEASYTASSDSCGTFGTFGTKLTPAGSPYSDTSISSSHCYEYKYLASDNVGNTTTYGPTSAVKPGPKGLSLTAENGGGTKKKADAKDIIKFTFTESIEPASITSAWSAASQPEQNVTVTFKDNGSGNGTNKPDNFSVTTAGVHIGAVEMSGGNWVPITGGSYSFNSTMKFGSESGKSVVTITLVSLQSGGTATPGEQSKDVFTWTPDKAITDTAGVAIDTSAVATPEAEHF